MSEDIAKLLLTKIEEAFEQGSIAELETRIRNLEYQIERKQALLRKEADLLDENAKRAIEISIQRNQRSLALAREEQRKKLEWHVNQVMKEVFVRLAKEAGVKEET